MKNRIKFLATSGLGALEKKYGIGDIQPLYGVPKESGFSYIWQKIIMTPFFLIAVVAIFILGIVGLILKKKKIKNGLKNVQGLYAAPRDINTKPVYDPKQDNSYQVLYGAPRDFRQETVTDKAEMKNGEDDGFVG